MAQLLFPYFFTLNILHTRDNGNGKSFINTHAYIHVRALTHSLLFTLSVVYRVPAKYLRRNFQGLLEEIASPNII